MRLFFLIVLALICGAKRSPAQNLVLNPSFEQLKPNGVGVACEFMQYSVFFSETLDTWTSFESMTPDVLRAAENCRWLQQVHGGEYCVGLVHYLPADDIGQKSDYHEWVTGRLSAPLRPGRRYRLECWVREDTAIIRDHLRKVYAPNTPIEPVRAGNLGFSFSVRPRQETGYKPQVNFADAIVTNGAWIKLSATFVPDQPFQFFTLGNFFKDAQTPNDLSVERHKAIDEKNAAIKFPLDRIKRAGYLCIDDISITPEPEPDAPALTFEKQLIQERKFTFSAGVLFDTDKAVLRPEAGSELDSLVSFLQKHPKAMLGISGHTDDTGSAEYNLDLSGRRAKAVRDYLLDKGIPEHQVDWKAFGETRPVAENSTEEGRQKNRRVECVLLKSG